MPFTPSHAIVALPFARTPLPAGAVAVGAMAPDLPLFFPWAPAYSITHGFPSLLWVSLPIAVALYGVWRLAIRPTASALLLPEALRARMPWAWDRSRLPLRELPRVAIAALIGVASHVFWDLFTHHDRPGAEWFPALGERWGPLYGANWLQHASSDLGLAGLTVWAVLACRRARPVHRTDRRAVGVIRTASWAAVGIALVAWFGGMIARDGLPASYGELRDTAFDAGTGAGATILVIALAASLAVAGVRRRV